MTFTADQYSQIAQGYEKAAADPMVASEKRADLVKKAEWFRFLAQRETHRLSRGSGDGKNAPTSLDAELKSRGRSWRSMAPFLTTLWITGAAVYLVSTVLFTNAVNLFGTEETPVPEIRQPVESVPKVPSAEANKTVEKANSQHTVVPERPHAISPDQPTYESPALTAPPPTLELAGPASDPVQEVSEVESAEVLIVTAAATIRNGPSKSSKKIGTATAGAELQVKAREKDWVQFVDPSSGNTGWIQSALLAPASGSEAHNLAVPEVAGTPPVKPAKRKLANKKPSAPAQIPRRPSAYADLPPDEEFLPPRRRGPGLLSRRRMLREGLMSPGFLPPD